MHAEGIGPERLESARRLLTGQYPLAYQTGANWAGPIGDYRLTVDKGRPDALVSFCETGVKKIGPTTFEVRRQNFMPTRDIDIMIVRTGE